MVSAGFERMMAGWEGLLVVAEKRVLLLADLDGAAAELCDC
jgi:hypothetical protein